MTLGEISKSILFVNTSYTFYFLFFGKARFGVRALISHNPVSRSAVRRGVVVVRKAEEVGGRASAAVSQAKEPKEGSNEKLDLQPPRGTRVFPPFLL